MLRQGFSARCQHQEEFVATKKLPSRHMKQAESINSFATRDLLSRHKLLQHEKAGCDRGRASEKDFCRDKVMYVATLKEEETLVATDKQGHDR